MKADRIAYNYIINAIQAQELKEGDSISETDIAIKTGVSRTPVREALRVLEAEGLVKSFPHKGCFVSRFAESDIIELGELRLLLEVWCLKRSFYRISDKDLDSCEALILDAIESGSVAGYVQADRMLHNLIVEESGGQHAADLLSRINGQLQHIRNNSSEDSRFWKPTANEHLAIIRHIRNNELEKAIEALTIHLNNSTKVFLVELSAQTRGQCRKSNALEQKTDSLL